MPWQRGFSSSATGFDVFPYYRVMVPGYLRIERESLAYFE
jgi:hypothetical protein